MQALSWQETETYLKSLSQKIRQKFKPDIIIAIAKGGWIPAIILSELLNVKKIASIGTTYIDSERSKLFIYSQPKLNFDPQRILIVEDRIETGKSLLKAKELIKNKCTCVRTAALFYRNDSIIIPDFYISLNNEIILFPWHKIINNTY